MWFDTESSSHKVMSCAFNDLKVSSLSMSFICAFNSIYILIQFIPAYFIVYICLLFF